MSIITIVPLTPSSPSTKIIVFWEQQGLQLASHKIQLSRGSDATKPAVRRHFEELIQKYEDVHIIDLLGIKDQGEVTLSQEYRGQVEALKPILKHIHMTRFDYHSQVKGGNYEQVQNLLQHIRGDSERYGYFYHDLLSNSIIQTQRGVFRTNCLDCLDRYVECLCNGCMVYNCCQRKGKSELIMVCFDLYSNLKIERT